MQDQTPKVAQVVWQVKHSFAHDCQALRDSVTTKIYPETRSETSQLRYPREIMWLVMSNLFFSQQYSIFGMMIPNAYSLHSFTCCFQNNSTHHIGRAEELYKHVQTCFDTVPKSWSWPDQSVTRKHDNHPKENVALPFRNQAWQWNISIEFSDPQYQ